MIRYSYILNALAFVFTIFIVLYGLSKGFNTLESIIHIMYFTTLILSQIENLRLIFLN